MVNETEMVDSDHHSKQIEKNPGSAAPPTVILESAVVDDDPLEKFMQDIESKATKQETFDDQQSASHQIQ